LRIAALALLLAAAPQEAKVDSACVGTWTLEFKNAQGTWTLTWSIHADGRYGASTRGPATLPHEAGAMQARGGTWSLKADAGRVDEGTYEAVDADTLSMAGRLGPGRWTRAVPKKVDAALVGDWTLDTLAFAVRDDGTYRIAAAGKETELGSITATGGRWSLLASSGRADEGTYESPDGGSLVLSGKAGPLRWRRPGAPAPAPAAGAPAEDLLTPPREPDASVLEYLAGLDALEAGRWDDALTAFDRAIQAAPKAHPYRYGRVVALVLSERFAEFFRELDAAYAIHNPRDDRELRCLLALGCTLGRDTKKLFWYHPSWLEHEYDRYLDRVAKAWARDPASGRPSFPGIAARFAADRRRDAVVAAALLARAFERHRKGDFAGGALDCERVIAFHPYSWTAMGKRAECLLALGAHEPARRLFTQLLSYRTEVTDGYLGRALAAARQGDAARMNADLDVARKLNAARTDGFRRAHAADFDGARPPAGVPQALYEDLARAARAGAPQANLVELAAAVRRAMAVKRLRSDEGYQEARRVLEWAKAADPRNPDRLAAIGNHLRLEAELRGECVEPRGAYRHYRLFEPRLQKIERDFAAQYCEAALKIDPEHVPALLGIAGVRIKRLEWDAAEQVLRRALALQPDAPGLLELFYEVQEYNASVQHWNAAKLRCWQAEEQEYSYVTTDTKAEQVGAGVYRVTTTTTTHAGTTTVYRLPGAEELARADRHEALAKQIERYGLDQLRRAAARPGADGFFTAGLLARREGRKDDAVRSLRRCVEADPARVRGWEQLGHALADQGLIDESNEVFDHARNLEETTASVQLAVAWRTIEGRNAPLSRTLLERAVRRDPADARIAAWRAVVEFMEKNDAEAATWSRVAAAQEEARAREWTSSFDAPDPGPLPIRERGLILRSRLFLGEVLLKAGKPGEALVAFRANLSIDRPGLSDAELGADMDLGLTPLTFGDKNTPREPTFLAGLLARSRWGAARALRALGRADEAAREIAAAGSCRRMIDDSLQINPITVRPGRKLPELEAFLASISR
jgi:tetratricopeptide (TPR) repeat protein